MVKERSYSALVERCLVVLPLAESELAVDCCTPVTELAAVNVNPVSELAEVYVIPVSALAVVLSIPVTDLATPVPELAALLTGLAVA